jgi:hypothetical protein
MQMTWMLSVRLVIRILARSGLFCLSIDLTLVILPFFHAVRVYRDSYSKYVHELFSSFETLVLSGCILGQMFVLIQPIETRPLESSSTELKRNTALARVDAISVTQFTITPTDMKSAVINIISTLPKLRM